jgi:hypothetical protein
MTDSHLSMVKTVIAILACALFVWQRRHPGARWTKWGSVLLAIGAMSAYFHFFNLPYRGFYHRWEMFHYYLGSKYSHELGYERLYRCAAVADAENGYEDSVLRRRGRDSGTDALVLARTLLEDPQACKQRFSDARWIAFKEDITWFRTSAGSGTWWEDMQQDHGYNASPVWTMIARPLSNLAPASDGFLKALAAIDVLLMAACLGVIAWAFGGQVAAIAAIFWGTQPASEFFWTGGAFLRQDWLFLLVLSAALLRKRRTFWAGAALTAAGLLRVFPMLLWAGPLILIARTLLRQGQIAPMYRRLLAGGCLSAMVLVVASIASSEPDVYSHFADRMALRAETPISNHMSLRTLFSTTKDTRLESLVDPSLVDPSRPWADARRLRLSQARPFYWLAAAGLVGLLGVTVWRIRSLWIALSVSLLLIPAVTDPSCYYYSVFVLAAPLCLVRRDLSVAMVALAGAGQLLCLRFTWIDDRFVALAAIYVLFAIVLVVALAPSRLTRSARRTEAGKRMHLEESHS